MFNVSDPHHFRKTIAGWCLIAAPLALLASTIVSPAIETDEGEQLAVLADHMDGWYITMLLLLVSLVLAVPALLGLMHMLRERRVALGHIGGGLGLLGVIASVGATAIGMVAWQMVAAGSDRAEMTALLERVNDTAGVVVPFQIGTFAIGAGFAVLALGLYLARAVHWSTATTLAAGAILLVIGYPVASTFMTVLGAALLVVGLGSIGWTVLAESDEDWEHTPQFRGFRPVAQP